VSSTWPPTAESTRALRWGLALVITLAVSIVRWLTAAHVLTGSWHAVVPQNAGGYLVTFLPVVLLILPEVNSLAFGGLKIEMRKTQDEVKKTQDGVSKLADQIHVLHVQQATAATASAHSGHQFVLADPDALAATLASVRLSASEKVADSSGDAPSSAVEAFLNPENPGMDQ
jgi:hypothetical protein